MLLRLFLIASLTAGLAIATSEASALTLVSLSAKLKSPTAIAFRPGNLNPVIAEQGGRIVTLRQGKLIVLADLSDRVGQQGGEQGLLGIAYHPQYRENGFVYIDYTDAAGDTQIVRLQRGRYDRLLKASATTVLSIRQPYANHNGGMAAFNPLARPGSADFGLLYIGNGDGGSGGDPQNAAQDLSNAFGKILRIDPNGRNSANGKYGIPAANPFVLAPKQGALSEIYAYGVRNPQRFAWDPANGTMYMADIGQNIVEEVSPVTAGANLGWNIWEGSYRYAGRDGVDATNPRGDAAMTFPIVEYAHGDPLLQRQTAVTGLHVFRSNAVPALRNKVLFGDNPQGELFYFDADRLPAGGVTGMHRVLLQTAGAEPKPLLHLIREKNALQAKQPASRADLRFGAAADGRLFLLNKADGTIRVLTR